MVNARDYRKNFSGERKRTLFPSKHTTSCVYWAMAGYLLEVEKTMSGVEQLLTKIETINHFVNTILNLFAINL